MNDESSVNNTESAICTHYDRERFPYHRSAWSMVGQKNLVLGMRATRNLDMLLPSDVEEWFLFFQD